MEIIDVVKEIKAFGVTQTEIASEVGTSCGHISDILSGRRGKRIGLTLGQNIIAFRDRLARRAKRAA